MFFGSRQYVLPQRELLRWSWARDRRGGTYEFQGFDIFQESADEELTKSSFLMFTCADPPEHALQEQILSSFFMFTCADPL